MPKEGKVLSDPELMSPEELEADRDRRRLRTSKLVSTMARAILDPRRDRFVIGTIGSSVAAGHDNCHYDSYEMQLERTLTPVFASAKMFAIVQNAGEGGGAATTTRTRSTASPTTSIRTSTSCTTAGRTSRNPGPRSSGSSSCGGRSAWTAGRWCTTSWHGG